MHNKLTPKMSVIRVTRPKFKVSDPLNNFWKYKATRSTICLRIYSLLVDEKFTSKWV